MQLERLAAHTGGPTICLVAPGEDRTGSDDELAINVSNLLAEAGRLLDEADLEREELQVLQDLLIQASSVAGELPTRHGVWMAISEDLGVVAVPLSPGVGAAPEVSFTDRLGLLRPLLEHEQRPRELLVLTLSDAAADLAVLDIGARELVSVGAPFPLPFEGDGTGVQARSTGSRQRDARRRNHWRRVAAAAHEVIVARDLPLVTVGVDRNHGFLAEVSAWPEELAVPVVASPDALDAQELIDRVLAAATEHGERRVEDARMLVESRRGGGRVATGVTDLYAAAVAGRIELLLLVDGPMTPGFLTPDGHLVLQDAGGGTPVADVHSLGITEVIRRGGRAVLAPDGTLDAAMATLRW